MDATQPPLPLGYAIRQHVAQMQRSNKKIPQFIQRCGSKCEYDFVDATKADISERLMAGMKQKSPNQVLIQVFNAIKDYETVLSTLGMRRSPQHISRTTSASVANCQP